MTENEKLQRIAEHLVEEILAAPENEILEECDGEPFAKEAYAKTLELTKQ